MTGQALFLSGKAAENVAYAYNSTVASGTVNGSVYTSCGHGANYLSPSLQARQIIEIIQTSEKKIYDWNYGTASLRLV